MNKFYSEIEKSIKILEKGQILLYPTDTVWGIGCDATNILSVKKLFNLKKRDYSKSMIVLVDSFEMLNNITNVSEVIQKIIYKIKRPITIVYDNPKGIAKNLISKDNTLGIRIVKHKFCNFLIKMFGKPIVSTSANFSGKKTPLIFKKIDINILKEVNYIVDLSKIDKSYYKHSFVVKILKNKIKILRK